MKMKKTLAKFAEASQKMAAGIVIASRDDGRNAFNEEDDQFIKLRKWANNMCNLFANISFFRRKRPVHN